MAIYKEIFERQSQAQSSPTQGMGCHTIPVENRLPVGVLKMSFK